MNKTHFFTYFVLIGYFSLFFTIPRGYNIGAGLLTVLSLISLGYSFFQKPKITLNKGQKYVISAFLIYALTSIIINFIHQNSISSYESYVKFLLALPIIWHLIRYPISPISFFSIIILATLFASSMGFYNVFYHGYQRITVGTISTIHFAGILQLFACIHVLGLSVAKYIQNNFLRLLYICLSIISITLALVCSVLSYSRGVWVALPAQVLLLSILYFKEYKKSVISMTLGMVIALTTVYFIPQTGVKSRINTAIAEVNQHRNQNHSFTSNGGRLELYKMALLIGQNSPIIGNSERVFIEKREQLIQNGIVQAYVKKLSHIHNHFLHKFAYEGMIGLLSLLILYGMCFVVFFRKFQSSQIIQKSLAAVGMTCIISYIIYNMTDFIMGLNVGIIFFIILISLAVTSKEPQTTNCTNY